MDDYQNEYNNYNEQEPKKRASHRKSMSPGVVIVSVICGCIMFLGFWYLLFSQFFGHLFGSLGASYDTSYAVGDTIDVIYVEGTISTGSSSYNHYWTLNQIESLQYDSNNQAIMLYIDSPGGGIYESDELYLQLKKYKEMTGRPVYAYMGSTAASGGVYVAMAADKIIANRMTMTGSIGVIMSLTDTTGLQELIGIKEETISSGEYKALGNPFTDEKRAILESLVDESYEIFVDVIEESRQLERSAIYQMADGRLYSPKQALTLDLIDDIMTYDEAMADLVSTYGLEACRVTSQSPPISLMEQLLYSMTDSVKQLGVVSQFGDIKSYIESQEGFKLMYMMAS